MQTKGNQKDTLRSDMVPSGPCCDALDATGLQDSFHRKPLNTCVVWAPLEASTGLRTGAKADGGTQDEYLAPQQSGISEDPLHQFPQYVWQPYSS